MEKTVDGLGEMLKGVSIRPPRLEDAGLEDCALLPESIMEAFSRAASSTKSHLTSNEDDDHADGCVQDPAPSNGEIPDTLVGGGQSPPGGSCAGTTGVPGKEGGDDVIVLGGWEKGLDCDGLLGLGEERGVGKPCVVDGLGPLGVEVGVEDGHREDDDDEDDKPILVEDLI